MSAQVHELKQGTPAWKSYRQNYFNASEASAMLGISSYKSRDALLEEKATGITPEINQATQRIFDEGHRLEKQALPTAEKLVGEDLFQPTMSKEVDGLNLSASYDGLTMLDDIVWEHKTLNKKLKASLEQGIIPEEYKPQLEQQMMVSGADKVLFMASNDDEEWHVWYDSEPLLRKRIIHGWKQFAEDLNNWQAVEHVVEPVAKAVEALPSLNVQIEGGVTRSNLDDYKIYALNFIQSINTDLKTDQDFADADGMVKFCAKAEKELEAVKKAALEQTADIAELFATIDGLKGEMRSKRLELDKLVKSRKQQVKGAMITDARAEFADHIRSLESRLNHAVRMPEITTDFSGVIKNKRTIESIRNALNTELARCKIDANELADLIDTNVKAMMEHAPEHRFLFTDLQQTCTKPTDDFIAMVKMRVAEYQAQEQRKLEAELERIRKEEEAKARAKSEAEAKEAAKAVLEARAEAEAKAEESHQEKEANNPKPSTHVDDTHVAEQSKPDQESQNEQSSFENWWDANASYCDPLSFPNIKAAKALAQMAWNDAIKTNGGAA